jgi:hypothetical protein
MFKDQGRIKGEATWDLHKLEIESIDFIEIFSLLKSWKIVCIFIIIRKKKKVT